MIFVTFSIKRHKLGVIDRITSLREALLSKKIKVVFMQDLLIAYNKKSTLIQLHVL